MPFSSLFNRKKQGVEISQNEGVAYVLDKNTMVTIEDKQVKLETNTVVVSSLNEGKLEFTIIRKGEDKGSLGKKITVNPKDLKPRYKAPMGESPKNKNTKLAIENPKEFLERECEGDWKKAVKMFRASNIEDVGMFALKDYREQVTHEISEKTKVELSAYIKNDLFQEMQESQMIPGIDGEAFNEFIQGYQVKSIVSKIPGSDDATSDIDINLQGTGKEWFTRRFNENFHEKFGTNSALRFDVNVYSDDFQAEITKETVFKSTQNNMVLPKGAALEDKTLQEAEMNEIQDSGFYKGRGPLSTQSSESQEIFSYIN